MPSRPSATPNRATERIARSYLGLVLSAALLALACGPGAVRGPAAAPGVPDELRPFLPPADTGYSLVLGPEASVLVERGHREGILAGRPAETRDIASRLLAMDPGLGPAQVLQAQASLLDRRYREAVEWAAPPANADPSYVAAHLVLGRAAEELGELSRAHAAYRSVADLSVVARDRAGILAPRVAEILASRVGDALARGRGDDALRTLRELELLDPESLRTRELEVDTYRALNRPESELAALVELLRVSRSPAPALRERRAELELEHGDPATGLQVLEDLQAEMPDRTDLAPRIERAKFLWRLRNLPPEVQDLLRKPELTRGDYAVLLYWLVPSVRSGVAAEARIATDILDHPQRQRIARVVNLGLVDLEPGVRRYEPDRPIRRITALESILRLLARRDPIPACVVDWRSVSRPSQSATCETARACELLDHVADCLPSAPLSAPQALEWIRVQSAY